MSLLKNLTGQMYQLVPGFARNHENYSTCDLSEQFMYNLVKMYKIIDLILNKLYLSVKILYVVHDFYSQSSGILFLVWETAIPHYSILVFEKNQTHFPSFWPIYLPWPQQPQNGSAKYNMYRKVASRSTSRLVTCLEL